MFSKEEASESGEKPLYHFDFRYSSSSVCCDSQRSAYFKTLAFFLPIVKSTTFGPFNEENTRTIASNLKTLFE